MMIISTSTFSFESLSSDNDDEVSFWTMISKRMMAMGIDSNQGRDEENANEEDPGFSWRSL